ncbi:hypothetical protein [Falsiroseomonas sp.]|uniref:hypothetical protein n=1 Tax=Falsiroseomonas sp. TaxID=2870721 RepID=UPI003F6F9B31
MRQAGLPDRDPPRSPQPDPLRQASADGRAALDEVKSATSEAAGTLRQEASGTAAELKAEGAEVLDAARQRALRFAETQQQAGAEQAEGFAEAVHGAADQLGAQSPVMARYVHEAATAIEDMGRTLRNSSPAELLGRVEDLARRQPVAFFGAAVLAGFGLARFAKSSAEAARHRGASGRMAPMGGAVAPEVASQAPGWVPPQAGSAQGTGIHGSGAKPATLAAASLGGAAAWPGGSASGLPQPPVAGGGDHV